MRRAPFAPSPPPGTTSVQHDLDCQGLVAAEGGSLQRMEDPPGLQREGPRFARARSHADLPLIDSGYADRPQSVPFPLPGRAVRTFQSGRVSSRAGTSSGPTKFIAPRRNF